MMYEPFKSIKFCTNFLQILFLNFFVLIEMNSSLENGRWYHQNTIKLFEILQKNWLHYHPHCMCKNLLGWALNTTRSNFQKYGFAYFIGVNELILYNCQKHWKGVRISLEFLGSIPFKYTQIKIKCIELAIWNTRLDIFAEFFDFKIFFNYQSH